MASNIIQGQREREKCPYFSATFLQLFDSYTEHFKVPTTSAEYWDNLCYLCNYAKMDFLQLTAPAVQEYFSSIASKVSLATMQNRLRIYLAVARYADSNALLFHIQPQLASAFQVVNIGEAETEYKPEDLPAFQDIDRVLAFLKESGDLVLFISIALALRCCQSTSTLINLQKQMFFQDLDGNYGLRIAISNVNYRFVKVPEDVAQLIIQYTKTRTDSSPYLLLNAHGKPLGDRTLQRRLRDACTASGVKPFTLQELRVLGTTIMIKGGAPLGKIAEYVNVKKTDWFFRYNRVVKELDDSAVDYSHLKITW